MQDEGIDFYRTDLYGTVTVTAQADGSFTVQTAKQPDEELAPAGNPRQPDSVCLTPVSWQESVPVR